AQHGNGNAYKTRRRDTQRAAFGAPDDAASLGHRAAGALPARIPGLRGLSGLLRAMARAPSIELCRALSRSDFCPRRGEYADLSRDRHQFQDGGGAVSVGLLRAVALLDQMAVGAVYPAVGGAFDPDHPVGALH